MTKLSLSTPAFFLFYLTFFTPSLFAGHSPNEIVTERIGSESPLSQSEILQDELFAMKSYSELKSRIRELEQRSPQLARKLQSEWLTELKSRVIHNLPQIIQSRNIGGGSFKDVYIIEADGIPAGLHEKAIALLISKEHVRDTEDAQSQITQEVKTLLELSAAGIPTVQVLGSSSEEAVFTIQGEKASRFAFFSEYIPNAMTLDAKSSLYGLSLADQIILVNCILGNHVETSEARLPIYLDEFRKGGKKQLLTQLEDPEFRSFFDKRTTQLYQDFVKVDDLFKEKQISDLQFILRTDPALDAPLAVINDPLGMIDNPLDLGLGTSSAPSNSMSTDNSRLISSSKMWLGHVLTYLSKLSSNPEKTILEMDTVSKTKSKDPVARLRALSN